MIQVRRPFLSHEAEKPTLITVFRPCLQLRFDWSVFAVDELHVELPGLRDLYVSKSLLARVVKA